MTIVLLQSLNEVKVDIAKLDHNPKTIVLLWNLNELKVDILK